MLNFNHFRLKSILAPLNFIKSRNSTILLLLPFIILLVSCSDLYHTKSIQLSNLVAKGDLDDYITVKDGVYEFSVPKEEKPNLYFTLNANLDYLMIEYDRLIAIHSHTKEYMQLFLLDKDGNHLDTLRSINEEMILSAMAGNMRRNSTLTLDFAIANPADKTRDYYIKLMNEVSTVDFAYTRIIGSSLEELDMITSGITQSLEDSRKTSKYDDSLEKLDTLSRLYAKCARKANIGRAEAIKQLPEKLKPCKDLMDSISKDFDKFSHSQKMLFNMCKKRIEHPF